MKNRQDSRALLLLYTYFPEQSYGTNRVMGFVLSPSLAEALLDDRFLERQGDICIFDAAGAPVCSTFAQTDSLPLFDDSEVHNCRIGDTDYQVQSLSGAYGLRYVSVIPTSEYYSGLQPIRSFTLLLILILLVLIVLISAISPAASAVPSSVWQTAFPSLRSTIPARLPLKAPPFTAASVPISTKSVPPTRNSLRS